MPACGLPLPPCYGVIPARWASSRFPGKPLADIAGRPMFWHVCQRAKESGVFKRIILATDDERISTKALELGVEALMTSREHASGTDRVYEAATLMGVPDDAVVVNIQGDEPALAPGMLAELVAPFADPGVEVTTLARELAENDVGNPDRVKVVLDAAGNALYFSRAAIPYKARHAAGDTPGYLLHVGLYAYRMRTLRRFTQLPPGRLERCEQLEQLRLLENSIPIRVGQTRCTSHGVDRPEDIAIVSRLLREK